MIHFEYIANAYQMQWYACLIACCATHAFGDSVAFVDHIFHVVWCDSTPKAPENFRRTQSLLREAHGSPQGLGFDWDFPQPLQAGKRREAFLKLKVEAKAIQTPAPSALSASWPGAIRKSFQWMKHPSFGCLEHSLKIPKKNKKDI